MKADASKMEQASFRLMLLTCENGPRLSVNIIAYPRKFSLGLPIGLFFINLEAISWKIRATYRTVYLNRI